ncbi:MAG: MazG-like family protein [bacterium]
MKELEVRVLKHLQERGWDKLRPSDIAKGIMIEGAELLEIFQWDNPALEEVRTNKEKIEKIKKELADVMIYALEMSVLLELDTKSIIHAKLDHIAKKYPAELMKKAKEPGTESEYWRIKREYREKGLNN